MWRRGAIVFAGTGPLGKIDGDTAGAASVASNSHEPYRLTVSTLREPS